MKLGRLAALAVWLALAGSGRADLKRARAEPNLEKRSQLALENARAQYQAARAAYEKGDNDQTAAAIAEIQESVELADASLKETHKDPRRSPKWFKKAEIETRDLLRKLDAFQQEMGFAERPMLEKVKASIQEIHDELLLGLMEGKRK
ncbi:MAG TPA: hypothetical protein VE959_08280 [Bryobacteraceae bacterium]|nr:hypothetical protein [Bryobacteraceae bacterium]